MKTAGGHISCEAALWGSFDNDHVASGHCRIGSYRDLKPYIDIVPVMKCLKWGNPEF